MYADDYLMGILAGHLHSMTFKPKCIEPTQKSWVVCHLLTLALGMRMKAASVDAAFAKNVSCGTVAGAMGTNAHTVLS